MRLWGHLTASVIMCIGLLACGGGAGGGDGGAAQSGASASSRVVHGAASKGPLQSAQVKAFEIDANGNKLSNVPIATGVTDSNGHFRIDPEVPSSQPLLVETSGGEFIDESDPAENKRRITLASGDGFAALLPPGSGSVAITPYSHALYARSRLEAQGGDFLAAFSRNSLLFEQGLGVAVATTIPQDPTNPDPAAPLAQRQYALLLGGFANALNNATVQLGMAKPTFELVKAMLLDMRDGRLDGMEGEGEPIPVRMPNGDIVALPGNIDLHAEVHRFRNNNASAYSNTAAPPLDENVLSQAIVPTITVDDTTVAEGADIEVRPGATEPGAAIRQNSGFKVNVLEGNDDGSTSEISLGFSINFFGPTFTSTFVNNNGNITFGERLGTYTPFGLTGNTSIPIIAPFFADVETDQHGMEVTYGTDVVDGRPAFGANWVDVDYYSSSVDHEDQLNSFQVVLIDRSDLSPGDFDIEFNYGKIRWETGDASDGEGGFGGDSARVGYSNGSGEEGSYFELQGSGINGAFLDANLESGLIYNSIGTTLSGRYIFRARRGDVIAPSVANFLIHLNRPTTRAVTVDFQTQDGTAHAGSDYESFNGTVRIPPGHVLGTVSVATIDDDVFEPDEDFRIVLGNPVGGALADSEGVATIQDDDE